MAVFVDEACLILMIGAVVEVPQSGQLLLYSRSLRPHFRQNGKVFTLIFYNNDVSQAFKSLTLIHKQTALVPECLKAFDAALWLGGR